MKDDAELRLAEILHKLGLTEEMVRDHVIRPEHIKTATVRTELRDVGDGDDPSNPPPPSGLFYRLNVQKLNLDLHNLLSSCVAGYSMQMRRYGRVIFDRQWQWAKMPENTPQDPGIPWASDIPMHIASVSKLITAMAMTKLLDSSNISPKEHILRWLPKYWEKGPGVDGITFEQLLTHTSGLVRANEAGTSDFKFMKEQIAKGTEGNPGYRNMNFGLCRILISTIHAPFLFGPLPTVNDAYWDLTTTRYYAQYVGENIFAPAGVTSTLIHTGGHALAYQYPIPAVPGWDSGDLSTMSGACGWHLSVNDLLTIMAAFRRDGIIVDPAIAQTMLDRKFGIDEKRDTALGRIYAKGGYWSKKVVVAGEFVEQCNVVFLPKGMELVILANSPFCNPNGSFMEKVLATIENNIHIDSTRLAVTVATFSGLAAFALWKLLAVTKE